MNGWHATIVEKSGLVFTGTVVHFGESTKEINSFAGAVVNRPYIAIVRDVGSPTLECFFIDPDKRTITLKPLA